ncbi:hypothetical protein KM043_010201 [Ampulex compressa]|nr:hypothetical protein KM043_010201 [Ampulex compressa]
MVGLNSIIVTGSVEFRDTVDPNSSTRLEQREPTHCLDHYFLKLHRELTGDIPFTRSKKFSIPISRNTKCRTSIVRHEQKRPNTDFDSPGEHDSRRHSFDDHGSAKVAKLNPMVLARTLELYILILRHSNWPSAESTNPPIHSKDTIQITIHSRSRAAQNSSQTSGVAKDVHIINTKSPRSEDRSCLESATAPTRIHQESHDPDHYRAARTTAPLSSCSSPTSGRSLEPGKGPRQQPVNHLPAEGRRLSADGPSALPHLGRDPLGILGPEGGQHSRRASTGASVRAGWKDRDVWRSAR